jgi:hypothetical protein
MTLATASQRAAQCNPISQIASLLAARIPLRFIAEERKAIADRRDNRRLPEFAKRVPRVGKTEYRKGLRADWLTSGNFKLVEFAPGYEEVSDNVHRIDTNSGITEIGGRQYAIRPVPSLEYAESAMSSGDLPSFAPLPVSLLLDTSGKAYLVLKPVAIPAGDSATLFARRREFALTVLSDMTKLHAQGKSLAKMNVSQFLEDGGMLVEEVHVFRAPEELSLGREFITAAAMLYGKGMLGASDIPRIVSRYYREGPVTRMELEEAVAVAPAQSRQSEKIAFATAFVESRDKVRLPHVKTRAEASIRSIAKRLFS